LAVENGSLMLLWMPPMWPTSKPIARLDHLQAGARVARLVNDDILNLLRVAKTARPVRGG